MILTLYHRDRCEHVPVKTYLYMHYTAVYSWNKHVFLIIIIQSISYAFKKTEVQAQRYWFMTVQ